MKIRMELDIDDTELEERIQNYVEEEIERNKVLRKYNYDAAIGTVKGLELRVKTMEAEINRFKSDWLDVIIDLRKRVGELEVKR